MDMETGVAQEIGMEDTAKGRNEVANDPSRRHERAVLPPGGVGLKLSVEMEAYRQQERAPDESSAGTRSPDTPEDDKDKEKLREKVKEKGRKRKKYRRLQHNKKVWLWKKELAEGSREGSGGGGGGSGASPSGRRPPPNRSNAALPAPNNTTQFIMEDHTDLQALDLEALRGSRTSRVRDPSFSIDSDEEFSSSPEDEAYHWKEFCNTYEDVHVERLGTMTKLDLIQEYLQLEKKVGNLEKLISTTGTDSESDIAEREMPIEPAMAEKIRIFQEEIQKLVVENEQLAEENKRLQSSSSLVRQSSSSLSSSIDSESDSSTSSGSSSSSSSGRSGASRSGGSVHSCNGKSSPQSAVKNNSPAIEMEDKTNGDLPSDQEMESESLNEDSMTMESVHEENSTVSSVTAH